MCSASAVEEDEAGIDAARRPRFVVIAMFDIMTKGQAKETETLCAEIPFY